MTYRERNSKKEQAEHRTVTIRQIWIASKGMSHGAYLARFRNKQTNTNRTRSTDRFIVRLRGLNRAAEQKYELRNDTVSKAVIWPRSNVETINPIPVKRINDVFSSFPQRQRKRVRFEFLSSWISRILVLPDCRRNFVETNSRTREWFENFTACQKCFISIKLFQNAKGSSRIFPSLFIPIRSFSNWFMIELYIPIIYWIFIINLSTVLILHIDGKNWTFSLDKTIFLTPCALRFFNTKSESVEKKIADKGKLKEAAFRNEGNSHKDSTVT